uniref:Uncharacterized protein n=1 Tax=Anguilla anguilla TaxID=7936 RepID=A0A0E9ULL9_ANGAN
MRRRRAGGRIYCQNSILIY